MSVRPAGRLAVLVSGLGLLTATPAAGLPTATATTTTVATAAAAGVPLRLAALNPASDPDLVVVVPPAVATAAIPASAFQVRQDGRIRRISANRVTDDGLDVHLVFDTASANTSLPLEQGLASDLLRNLPAQVRTATATSGSLAHAPQSGRLRALDSLAQVRPDPAATPAATASTLAAIASAPTDGRRRILVLFTGCRPGTAAGFPELGRLLARGQQQLDVVAPGAGCGPALAAQARASGGLGLVGLAPGRLAEAVDAATYDILGQYRLSVHAGPATSPLQVVLDYAGLQASTTVTLPKSTRPATPAAAGHNGEPQGSGGSRALAAVAAIILAVTAVGYVHAFRRRTPPVAA